MYIASGMDDTVERKIKRIKSTRLDHYFDSIIIYGERAKMKSLYEAIAYILNMEESCNTSKVKVYYIDDKPVNLLKIRDLRIQPINYISQPPFPRAYNWCLVDFPANNIIKMFDHVEILSKINIG